MTQLNPIFLGLDCVDPKERIVHLDLVCIDKCLTLHLHDRVGRFFIIFGKIHLSLNKPFFYGQIIRILLYFFLRFTRRIYALYPFCWVAHLNLEDDLSWNHGAWISFEFQTLIVFMVFVHADSTETSPIAEVFFSILVGTFFISLWKAEVGELAFAHRDLGIVMPLGFRQIPVWVPLHSAKLKVLVNLWTIQHIGPLVVFSLSHNPEDGALGFIVVHLWVGR